MQNVCIPPDFCSLSCSSCFSITFTAHNAQQCDLNWVGKTNLTYWPTPEQFCFVLGLLGLFFSAASLQCWNFHASKCLERHKKQLDVYRLGIFRHSWSMNQLLQELKMILLSVCKLSSKWTETVIFQMKIVSQNAVSDFATLFLCTNALPAKYLVSIKVVFPK